MCDIAKGMIVGKAFQLHSDFAHFLFVIFDSLRWDDHTIRTFVAILDRCNQCVCERILHYTRVCFTSTINYYHFLCFMLSIFELMVRYIQVGDRKLRIKCGK